MILSIYCRFVLTFLVFLIKSVRRYFFYLNLQNEPRRGEYTVVHEKSKPEIRLTPQIRKITQSNVNKPFEIVNAGGAKHLDRPKTAIVLPTYQNKKITAVTKKPVKATTNEEQQSRLAALQLLEEHGIEMLEGEDINLVASAVGSGQTVVLTEAGKQALSLTGDKNVNRIKAVKRSSLEIGPSTPKFIRISNANDSINSVKSAKRFVRISKASPKKIQVRNFFLILNLY